MGLLFLAVCASFLLWWWGATDGEGGSRASPISEGGFDAGGSSGTGDHSASGVSDAASGAATRSAIRPNATEALSIRCRLVDGSALSGANVQVWSEAALLAMSNAGQDGIASIEGIDSLEGRSVIGSASGHRLDAGMPLADSDQDYELVFEAVDSVRVEVRDHRGHPVPGARVAYWPTHTRFDPSLSRGPHSTERLVNGIARTESDGTFTVPRQGFEGGLHAIAVADGVTSREPSRLGEQSGTVVTVRPAYVAFFRWSTPDFGRPLADPELFRGGIGWGPRELDGYRAGDLPEDGLALRLLGVDPRPRGGDDAGGGFDARISYFGEALNSGFAGVDLRVSLPGYEEWTGGVELHPIGSDPGIREVMLHSAGAEFGIVVVDIGEELPRLLLQADAPAGRAVAWLWLRPIDGGRACFYRLATPVERRFEIRGVPFGAYRATLELLHSGWHSHTESDSPRIRVGPEPAELYIDHEPLGALRLVPRTSAGEPYRRELGVALAWGGGEDTARLDGPPYLVLGLEPGPVRVSLRKAFDRLWSETETPLGAAEIVAGERTWLEVRLPREDAR